MSQPSLQHLLDLEAGPNWVRLTQESISRVQECALAPSDRELFFPNANVSREEERILQRCSQYAEAAAVHFVMRYLAQEEKIPEAERKRINVRKAALFFRACAQRSPPSPGTLDYVAQYGWNREHDRGIIERMQSQRADLYHACNRLAFLTATPEMAQYTHGNPAQWYNKLADHLLSDSYANVLAMMMVQGSERIIDILSDAFTKLEVLHEAAHGQVSAPPSRAVIASLWAVIGLPGAEVDLTFQKIPAEAGSSPFANIDILGNLERLLDASLPSAEMMSPTVRRKALEEQVVARVRQFGEGPGRKYGLWE